jgi:hypothetical protein
MSSLGIDREELADRANRAMREKGSPICIPTYYKMPLYYEFKVFSNGNIYGRQRTRWYAMTPEGEKYLNKLLSQNGYPPKRENPAKRKRKLNRAFENFLSPSSETPKISIAETPAETIPEVSPATRKEKLCFYFPMGGGSVKVHEEEKEYPILHPPVLRENPKRRQLFTGKEEPFPWNACRCCGKQIFSKEMEIPVIGKSGKKHLGVYKCPSCEAIQGECYLGESYDLVLPQFDREPEDLENQRYYDLKCLGSKGFTRRHGWYNPRTHKITQTG